MLWNCSLAVCLVFAFSSAHSAVEQYTPMIGYESINVRIKSRLMKKDATFNIGQYLDSKDLIDILRPRYGDGLINEDRNGRPNKINLLLWHVIAEGLANDLAQACDNKSPMSRKQSLADGFLATLRSLCQNPASEATLRKFWLAVIGYSAPLGEFIAWRDFAKGAKFTSEKEAVKSLFISLFFNPYFLLKL